jgi:hypothetical protein
LLETKRDSILLSEEQHRRLQSRETWLNYGDTNSKFFHHVASFNRAKKYIWSLKGSEEDLISGQRALQEEAVSHFSRLYKKANNLDIQGMVSTATLFPSFVSTAEAAELYKPVTLSELKQILDKFKLERSPGPDGWTTEFFCFFFELVGPDLLQMVENTRITGKIVGSLNSTFLVLIPKESNPLSYSDFRPISLCNLIYKLISKVISNRIKPFLERRLSAEQLGFLRGRRIQDAIGAAHEGIHSIKKYKQKALVMKLDLKQAFDCIDWEFLRLILFSAGFGELFIRLDYVMRI